MKRIFTWIAVIALMAVLPHFASAQFWSELGPIFEQLNEEEQNNFLEQLDNLQDSWGVGNVELNSIVDSLNNDLTIFDPTAPIDSMLEAWDAGRDSLSSILGNSELSSLDSLAVMQEYDGINAIWELNLDSLNTILEQYQDGSEYNAGWLDEAVIRFEVFSGLWTQTFEQLEKSLLEGLDSTEPVGLGNMPSFMDTLFSSMFDLEIAFGQLGADIRFYNEAYNAQAMEFRVGSVPRFDDVFEARWHVQASYFTATEEVLHEVSSLPEGLNALQYQGNFSVMYNPVIGSIGHNGRMHLYSSLGMEVGTYVPAHVDNSRTETLERIGKTTGYGPQIGAGFVINTGDIAIYSYGTYAQGSVSNSPGYQYRATGARAGIRYGNVAHVSYQYTKSHWANSKNKYLEGNSVTVGIILSELMN
ncbi:MAG: hypothetical protein MI974_34515 [Chitinophagales bacterium]|nr:hypothetical protein [Chitinophagales bacterium]